MSRIRTLEMATVLLGMLAVYSTSEAANEENAGAAGFYNPSALATDGAGNIYVADTSNNTVRKVSPAGVVTTLAGTLGMPGHADGAGTRAGFNNPGGVVADHAGNIYVADTGNHTIRKITPAGVVTTLAGSAGVAGNADGAGAQARFNNPSGLAADRAGNLYVTDSLNHTIRKITPAGVVTTLAGSAGTRGHADGTGAHASFDHPGGIAADSTGNLYVADIYNGTIRKVSLAGVVTTLAGTAGNGGHADGTGAAASFSNPVGVATDSAGNIYVADTFNHTIRKISPAGVATTLAGTANREGHADGSGKAASFSAPFGLATDNAGNLYVADYGNHTIRKIVQGSDAVTTLAGQPGAMHLAAGNPPRAALYQSR